MRPVHYLHPIPFSQLPLSHYVQKDHNIPQDRTSDQQPQPHNPLRLCLRPEFSAAKTSPHMYTHTFATLITQSPTNPDRKHHLTTTTTTTNNTSPHQLSPSNLNHPYHPIPHSRTRSHPKQRASKPNIIKPTKSDKESNSAQEPVR